MNGRNLINDPTINPSLLKSDSFQPFITDEYAFAVLLKNSSFPIGVKVYGSVPYLSNNSTYASLDNISSSLVLQNQTNNVRLTSNLADKGEINSVQQSYLSPLPIGVTYEQENQSEYQTSTLSSNEVLQSYRYGSTMTKQEAIAYLQRQQMSFTTNQFLAVPRQFKYARTIKGNQFSPVQWNRIVSQKSIRNKIIEYSKATGINAVQHFQEQVKLQTPKMAVEFLNYGDDTQEVGQAIQTTTQIQQTKQSIQTGSTIAKKSIQRSIQTAKKIRSFPKSIPKEISWWKNQVFRWWQSPNKMLSIRQVVVLAIKNVLKNPIIAIKGLLVSLVPLGIFLSILIVISAVTAMMGSGVAQGELELTKAWEEITLRDYEETDEIRGVEKPLVDGTEVEPSSVTFNTDIDEFLVYMNAKFEDYRLDKAISKKNPETHRAFLNRLYHKVVVNKNPEWQLKNFGDVIQENDFRLGKKASRYQLIQKQSNPYFEYQELINPFDKENKNSSITITKRYGYYYKETGILHKAFRSGIIVDASKGQAVYAPKAGKIRYSGSSVIIETNSKRLRMDNITSFRVSEGNKVKRGTLIGNVARAGGVFIEYKKKQKILWANVNPAFYFPKVNYTEKTTYQASTVEVAGDVGQRALQVYQLFKKFFPQTTINGASAFLGNFQVESGINPKRAEGDYLNPPVGATATSWDDDNWLNMGGMEIYGKFPNIVHRGLGLGQFTDTLDGSRRNTLIREFAKKKGKKWYDLELQIEFMFTEDTPYYQALVRRVLSSNDLPSVLANEVLVYWEGNPGDKVAQRQASAIQWAKYLQNPPKAGKYAHAVPNAPTSSGFGWRNFGGMSEFHRGIDYAVPQGTPIHAIADGKVIVAEYHYSWGNHVHIVHKDGTSSNYAHMSQIKAHVGQQVKQGDVIGLVGSTGNSTGPHLHLEISRSASLAQGELIDPATVLGK